LEGDNMDLDHDENDEDHDVRGECSPPGLVFEALSRVGMKNITPDGCLGLLTFSVENGHLGLQPVHVSQAIQIWLRNSLYRSPTPPIIVSGQSRVCFPFFAYWSVTVLSTVNNPDCHVKAGDIVLLYDPKESRDLLLTVERIRREQPTWLPFALAIYGLTAFEVRPVHDILTAYRSQ
jgi:hypothetical protein